MTPKVLLAAIAGLLLGTAAAAQDFKGPIKIVVPFAPGGATDAVARLLAPGLSKQLGQQVIIDNRPGASGQLGTAAVKSAPADGSTFLLALDHSVVVVPLITPTAGYDALKDFVPVGQVARFQWTFAVPLGSPAKTLVEFVDAVRKDPAQGNYGVPLQGGVPDIIGAAISRKASVKMEPIPFGGSAMMMPQLIGGQLASGVTGEPEGVTMFKGGKVRLLAISGGKRSALLPNVPTFEELGFSGVNVNSFNAFFAPKALPRPLAEKFNAALRATLGDREVQQKIHEMSLELAPTDLSESGRELVKSYEFWHRPENLPK
ncbi:tripartite tricarboxylate transporter substrate-binding protein [Azohydromonas lata]|uniref:Tripartite tricarboxylate transporter substrate-binding protein n=1 Tax=Azohydromonas lata TaxID=45677 RepID=A0ABU5IQL8_9BURK|nr:tripartite tricarboxylate transporter substrate-binding protein [Azohydromonas lata]MDZ5461197.1 tripartite tricarboxylate transporter substrate-binding protein [Azohydromonas lata]